MHSSTSLILLSLATVSLAQIDSATAPGCLMRCYQQKLNEINNPGLAPGVSSTNTAALCAVPKFTQGKNKG